MDASRLLTKINRKGFSLIYLALILTALLGFFAFAVDIGYRHVVKAQLQNAADAGALAGAGSYKDQLLQHYRDPLGTPINKSTIKNTAQNFAQSNNAAGSAVQVSNDLGSNTINSSNDITLGFWSFSTAHYDDGSATPVNAVKVRTRKTSDSPAGAMNTIFAKILGWNTIDVQAAAVAALPAGAGLYLAACDLGCTADCIYPTICDLNVSPKTPIVLQKPTGSGFNYANSLTWTSLDNTPTSASTIGEMVCGSKPYKTVCNKPIYNNSGSINSQFQNLEAIMYDPNIDKSNKDISGNKVDGWWTILPVLEKDPLNPTQCQLDDNHLVVKYMLVRIKAICSSGATTGPGICSGGFRAPPSLCGGGPSSYPNDSIVIDRISCIDCNSDFMMPGLEVKLVK